MDSDVQYSDDDDEEDDRPDLRASIDCCKGFCEFILGHIIPLNRFIRISFIDLTKI